MGKASKWFLGLLGLKKSDPSPQPSTNSKPPKRRWSFVKSYREKRPSTSVDDQRRVASRESDDVSNHAVAVAAAKAAVAEAAIATAHAANAVVKLTSSSGRSASMTSGGVNNAVAYHSGFGRRREEEAAAVKIQSNFRAYLSRRALKALKALVKLQALVKGYLVRKHAAYELRCLQAIIRAQTRSRIGRSQISDSPHSSSKSSHCHHPGPPTPEKFDHPLRSTSMKHQPSLLKRNGSNSYARVDSKIKGPKVDEKGDKILEIDPGKPHSTPRRRNLFQSSEQSSHSHSHSFTTSRGSTMHQTAPSPSSGEVNSFSPLIFTNDIEEMSFFTAENSPQFYAASSKGNSSMRGPFTPNKSDRSRSCLSGYSEHPNYMSYTESARAKVRSLSAPRQRLPHFDISGMTKRHSIYGYGDPGMQKASALHANFASKAYPGSGRLDRLGMPVGGGGGDMAGYSGDFLNRYKSE